ncbi:MAG: hypothetical protein KGO50_19560, partial [Myxococcales bacterium]|nr:hypothetical protein [Myxococcales bacterium]
MDAAALEKLLWETAYGAKVGSETYTEYPGEWQGANGEKLTGYEKYTNPGEVSVRGFVALLKQAEELGLLPDSFSFFDLGCSRGHTCLIALLAFQCRFAYGIELANKRILDGLKALQLIRNMPGDPHGSRLAGNIQLQCGNVLVNPDWAVLKFTEVCWWADEVFDEVQWRLIWEHVIPNMQHLKLLIVNKTMPVIPECYRFQQVRRGSSSVSWKHSRQPFLFYVVLPRAVDRSLEPNRQSARIRGEPRPVVAVEVRAEVPGNGLLARPSCTDGAPKCDNNTCGHIVKKIPLQYAGAALLFNRLLHAGVPPKKNVAGLFWQLFCSLALRKDRPHRGRLGQPVETFRHLRLDRNLVLQVGAEFLRTWDTDLVAYRAQYDHFEGRPLIPNSMVEMKPKNGAGEIFLNIEELAVTFPLLGTFLQHVVEQVSSEFEMELKIQKVLVIIKDTRIGCRGFAGKSFHYDYKHGTVSTSVIGPFCSFDTSAMPASVGK